jgi:pimeloyl-ACP methyl ester carboxylesterase
VRVETRYAKSGELSIAYQVVGEGPLDLVFVMGWVSHLDWFWEEPSFARFLRRLAAFSRLILFDKRGTGLSDRLPTDRLPTLEERMDDVRAVMDAVASERAALVGVSEGAPLCTLFAATYPERTRALVIFGGYARRLRDDDHPWAPTREEREQLIAEFEANWGKPVLLGMRAPSIEHDESFKRWWGDYLRMSASPGAATALTRMNIDIDVRHVLPAVRVPTLVLHRIGDRSLPVEYGRYIAAHVPDAKLVELQGDDHLPFVGDQEAVVGEIQEFLTGVRHEPEPDRVLATVVFTDIVGSTRRAAELGDAGWRDLLERHDGLVRRALERWRGREIDTAGDGFLATFDGPARAVRFAREAADSVRGLGLEIRAGVHTGEVELSGGNVRGIAVHIGARVAAEAGAGEVLVSQTVKDLVGGSGLEFEDRGARELRGVPGEWRLYRVAG